MDTEPRSARLDELEGLLEAQGHNIGSTRVRIAVARSGVVVGFPRDPMIHVSWWVLLAAAVLARAGRRRRSR
jgi:hypothetical protein